MTDARVKAIWSQLYRCVAYGKTTTARPAGVGRAGISQPFTTIVRVLYALFSSHRSVGTD